MFGLGLGEWLLLAIVGIFVVGPKQLPQVAKIIGRTWGEFQRVLHEVKRDVINSARKDDGSKNSRRD